MTRFFQIPEVFEQGMRIGGIIRGAIAACAVLLAPAVMHAQETLAPSSIWQIGGTLSGALGASSAQFSQMPGVTNCLESASAFDGGSGSGFGVAALVARKPGMAGDWTTHLGFSVRLGYAAGTTAFETEEPIGRASDPLGNIHTVMSRYTVEASLGVLRLEPSLQYHAGADFPMTVSVGTSLGYVLSGSYEQNEQIVSPVDAKYEGGATVRNETSGDLQELTKLQGGLTLGLGYDIMLSPTATLRPELTGFLSLTRPISSVRWNPNELRLGVSILFAPFSTDATPLEPGNEE